MFPAAYLFQGAVHSGGRFLLEIVQVSGFCARPIPSRLKAYASRQQATNRGYFKRSIYARTTRTEENTKPAQDRLPDESRVAAERAETVSRLGRREIV